MIDQSRKICAAVGDASVEVEFGGTVISAKAVDSHTSEMLGFAAAIIVLLIVLGTAVAMALPMTLALVSIGTRHVAADARGRRSPTSTPPRRSWP